MKSAENSLDVAIHISKDIFLLLDASISHKSRNERNKTREVKSCLHKNSRATL